MSHRTFPVDWLHDSLPTGRFLRMGGRPYVSPKAVCRAMVLVVGRRAAEEKHFTLSMALMGLTGEDLRFTGSAIREAMDEGLLIRTAKGYRLTESGKPEVAREPNWRPKSLW